MNAITQKEQQVRPRPAPFPQDDGSIGDGRPPLNSGDRLSRAEFERRYDARPDIKKAELIEGVVYVASPVYPQHGEPHSDIIGWLSVYRAATPGIRVSDNTSLRLDADNEPQPDVCVWVDDPTGEALRAPRDSFLEITPDLIVEVAASSASYDLHDKLNAYRRNGVQEYLVLLVWEQETRWHTWQEGEYQRLEPGEDGILRSRVLPGLWLHPERFWAGDLAGVLSVLQRGLASPEHEAFVRTLRGDDQ
ncbi:MAG: Uma2 family endonuclease [Anaerolineae bacterium]